MLSLSPAGDGDHGRGASGRRALTVAGSVVPILRFKYKPQPTTTPRARAPYVCHEGDIESRVHTRTTLWVPIQEQCFPDVPKPAVARTHPSPVVVSAALRRVSPAGRRPRSWSPYRPRAGPARGRFRGNHAGAGRPNAGAEAVGLFLSPTQTTGWLREYMSGLGVWLNSRV